MALTAFAVNVDVTMVNVALPSLLTDLDASNRQLQWIVDGYTLTFAALVLAAGFLGDRFGRRNALLVGTLVYALGNTAGALSQSSFELTAARMVMGVGAAIMFPTTLSVLVNVFRDRKRRAMALGVWGASTGLAIAMGPIAGGALLEAYSWHATFWAKLPVAALVIAATLLVVPDSRDPEKPRVDLVGLLLSVAAVATVVYAVIEAPAAGWRSAQTIGLLAAAAGLLALFIAWERRVPQPMLDVRLFADRRFSISSAAITVSFFALSGFIFLVTQYFQILRGYGPLETGVRILPVALSVAVSSTVGIRLALRIGNKVVVGTGLTLLAATFVQISTNQESTPYAVIVLQMIGLGTGIGLTTSPATEALMGTVSEAKAGAGAGVNDATRELGGTLGVAVIGSVFATLFARPVGALPTLPNGLNAIAEQSIAAALAVSRGLAEAGAAGLAQTVRDAAVSGFFDGFQAGTLVAGGVAAAGAIVSWALLPNRPREATAEPAGATDGPVGMTAGHESVPV
jgi:EmrB/QacA subfamily drug resistance transporter